MPLVDLKTDLKSLKYGRDRLNGGSSREPFISKDIEDLRLSDLHRTGGSDLLIRGGFLLPGRIADDEIRLGKWFTTTEGALWTATQNVLSRGAVKLQAGYRAFGGQNFRDTLANIKELAGLALSEGLGGNGLGGVPANLRNRVNPLNQGTYTPFSTLAAAAGTPIGYHPNKQGIDFTGTTSLSLITYSDLVTQRQPIILNRLASLHTRKMTRKSSDPVLLSYSGGPGSDLGYGRTEIKFADQRTGINLSNQNYWSNQVIATTLNSDLVDITKNGVSSRASSEFSSYFDSPIRTVADNRINPLNGRRFFVKSATDKFYTEKKDTRIDRNSVLNLPNAVPFDINGLPNPEFDPSSIRDINTIAGEYTKNFKKEYKVKDGPESVGNFNPSIPNPDRRFDDPNLDGRQDYYADLARTGSTQTSSLAPAGSTVPTETENGVTGNGTINNANTPSTASYQKSFTPQPSGSFIQATQVFNDNNPVYGDILNTVPSPTEQDKLGNNATLTQEELYKAANATHNTTTIIDYRRRVQKKKTPESLKNGSLTNSLDWDQNPSKRIATRVRLGDPGSPNIDRSDYTKGGGTVTVSGSGAAQYPVVVKPSDGTDRINSLYLYKSSQPADQEDINDLVKFRIATIDPENPKQVVYNHFRAFLNEMSDDFSSEFDSFKYLGRAENFYTYKGFSRNMTIGWTVAAQSKEEMAIMYKKLNYLASTTAPNYSDEGFMRGNIHRLTIGGYLYEYPGIIEGISYTIPQESPWDIAIPTKTTTTTTTSGKVSADKSIKELPHIINVSMKFRPIDKFLPRTVQDIDATGDTKERFISLQDHFTNNNNDLYMLDIPAWAKPKKKTP